MKSGREAARIFAYALWVFIFGGLAMVIMVWGQDIEAYFWPVVIETKPADGIYREGSSDASRDGRAFFTLHLKKVLPGEDPRYNCYAEALLSPRLPLSIYPSDATHRRFGQDLKVHPVGEKWDRTFGFELPATVAENQLITVYCSGSHDQHRGWRSVSYLKPVRICGLVPDDPPADLPRKADPFCDKQRAAFAAPSP